MLWLLSRRPEEKKNKISAQKKQINIYRGRENKKQTCVCVSGVLDGTLKMTTNENRAVACFAAYGAQLSINRLLALTSRLFDY